jgi:hypothetical protein
LDKTWDYSVAQGPHCVTAFKQGQQRRILLAAVSRMHTAGEAAAEKSPVAPNRMAKRSCLWGMKGAVTPNRHTTSNCDQQPLTAVTLTANC